MSLTGSPEVRVLGRAGGSTLGPHGRLSPSGVKEGRIQTATPQPEGAGQWPPEVALAVPGVSQGAHRDEAEMSG